MIDLHNQRSSRSHLSSDKKAEEILNRNKVKGFLSSFKENKENKQQTNLITPESFVCPVQPAGLPRRVIWYHGPPLCPPDLQLTNLPPPCDNKVYSPIKALTILFTYIENGSSKRKADAIRKKLWLHWIAVGLVPVKDSNF